MKNHSLPNSLDPESDIRTLLEPAGSAPELVTLETMPRIGAKARTKVQKALLEESIARKVDPEIIEEHWSEPVCFSNLETFLEDTEPKVVVRGKLKIIPDYAAIYWDDQLVDLTPHLQRMVVLMSSRPGRVWERDVLLSFNSCYGMDCEPTSIDSLIKRIRASFKRTDADFNQIESIRGLGYRWLPVAKLTNQQM